MKTLGYGIKQGFKNIVQNKIFSLVAIGTIAICLFLLGDGGLYFSDRSMEKVSKRNVSGKRKFGGYLW